MVQIDIPAGFVVGMFAVDLGRKALKLEYENTPAEKSALYFKYLFRSVLFAGMVIAPAGIYLLAGWPGWEQIYWSRRFEEVMHTGWRPRQGEIHSSNMDRHFGCRRNYRAAELPVVFAGGHL
jgi:hypothetical protein